MSDLTIQDFCSLEDAVKCHSQVCLELPSTFTPATIGELLQRTLQELKDVAHGSSDSGIHTESDTDSVCETGGRGGGGEPVSHHCNPPLSNFQASTAVRWSQNDRDDKVCTEGTGILIRGMHVYRDGEILSMRAKEEEEEEEESEHVHKPRHTQTMQYSSGFNHSEAAAFLWKGD